MPLTEEQKDVLRKLVGNSDNEQVQTLGGFAGTGKAQPLYSSVCTPAGFVRMSDIHVGDVVCVPDGSSAIVNGVFPQGEKACCRVWFSDGSFVDACEDHLWMVHDRWSKKDRILSTKIMANKIAKSKRSRYTISTPAPIAFVASPIPVDPYLLGVLIGDGSITDDNFAIHNVDDEIIGKCLDILQRQGCDLLKKDDVTWKIVGSTGSTRASSSVPLRISLRDLDLWNKRSASKFVPGQYLLNSVDIRREVLRGLMDTDGTVDRRTGVPSITTTSVQLAKDVKFLVESLGGICTISTKLPFCTYQGRRVEGSPAWVCNIRINDVKSIFKLQRKKDIAVNRTKYPTKRVVNRIEDIGPITCQCIMIDHVDHLYITDFFVPTHNTTIINTLSKAKPMYAVAAYTGKAANVLRKKGLQGAATIHSLIYRPWKDANDQTVWGLAGPTDLTGIEGFIIDEASMVSQEIDRDLRSFNLPIIYVGDHGQLEPIGGTKFNLMANPIYKLETVHRNAGEIAHFANHLRQGNSARTFPGLKSVQVVRDTVVQPRHLSNTDQVIVAFNKTRVKINSQVREERKINYTYMAVGEKIMCLRNNRKLRLFNGMQGTVSKIRATKGDDDNPKFFFDFTSDGEYFDNIQYDPDQFGKETNDFSFQQSANPFDYAYAITCHKAQGDQFGNVIVYEQVCDKWDHRRWSYTAASRAMYGLVWVESASYIPNYLR